MIVVSDSSPLIFMARLGFLPILQKLYKTIMVPEAVYTEVIVNGKEGGYADAFMVEKEIGSLIIVKNIENKFIQQLKELKIAYGEGESEALILCMQEKADMLLVDDYEPRKLAESRGIKWISSIGILFTSLKKGFIGLNEYKQKIGELSRYAWLSGDVVAKFMEAGYNLKGGG